MESPGRADDAPKPPPAARSDQGADSVVPVATDIRALRNVEWTVEKEKVRGSIHYAFADRRKAAVKEAETRINELQKGLTETEKALARVQEMSRVDAAVRASKRAGESRSIAITPQQSMTFAWWRHDLDRTGQLRRDRKLRGWEKGDVSQEDDAGG